MNQPEQDQKFDRRDVYIITQNALADGTYLNYIRAQYNRSTKSIRPSSRNSCASERKNARDEHYTPQIFWPAWSEPLDDIFDRPGRSHRKTPAHVYFVVSPKRNSPTLPGSCRKLECARKMRFRNSSSKTLAPKTQQLLSSDNDKNRSQVLVRRT